MKKIEEIIEIMKSINPDIKMDENFKKSLKNKLEVTSYAKLKNTKNKKVNIAKSWFFSLKKTNKNIFEKPKINFLKILSPLFVWAFTVFWFFNFYWNNLFITDKWWDFNYKIEKINENTEIIDILWNQDIQQNIIEQDLIINNELSESTISDNIDESLQNIDLWTVIPEFLEFEEFCNSKNWKILNNICSYWELECSLDDFINNKCDKN